MRRLRLAVLPLAACGLLAAAPAAVAAGWPSCTPRATPIRTGLTVLGRTRHGRIITYILGSRAMQGVQRVDVQLPARYDRSGRTRYPLLLLLHGAGSADQAWDPAELRILAPLRAIVVMPSGAQLDPGGRLVNGDYSDWLGLPPGASGPVPAWESYHVGELLPFVDRVLPTRRDPAGRAVMGISMGGGGAMKYAAAYPGTFGYAGSLSGSVDPELPVAQQYQPKTCAYGDPSRHLLRWQDNDPTYLAGNLRGVRLFVRSGDGTPGPFDAPEPPADPVLALIRQTQLTIELGADLERRAFVTALRRAGVETVDDASYPGSHSAPYWRREMSAFATWLGAEMRRPPRVRRSFAVRSARARFTAWGWRFTVHRSAPAMLRVRVDGLRVAVTGGGRVGVVTPPRVGPRSVHVLRIDGRRRRLVADARGRLRFTV